MDTEDDETIYEGQIGDFNSFESQIEAQLKSVGFQKNGLFQKNIACVSFPVDSTPSHKLNILRCFDQLGFSEIYLVAEHVALARALATDFPRVTTFGIIDAGCSKVDISMVQDASILRKSSLKLGKDRYSRYLSDPVWSRSLFQFIADDAKGVFEGFLSNPNFQIFLTGGRMHQAELREGLIQTFEFNNPVEPITDHNELVIAGLASCWIGESQKGK